MEPRQLRKYMLNWSESTDVSSQTYEGNLQKRGIKSPRDNNLDYYFADNEGHIMAKITNDSRDGKTLKLNAGDRFMQGIFLPFGITYNDEATEKRTGGFGSTGN